MSVRYFSNSTFCIGERPDAVGNITVVSHNFESLVVDWCPAQPSVNYTLYWSLK